MRSNAVADSRRVVSELADTAMQAVRKIYPSAHPEGQRAAADHKGNSPT
jgi:hypothetical protein